MILITPSSTYDIDGTQDSEINITNVDSFSVKQIVNCKITITRCKNINLDNIENCTIIISESIGIVLRSSSNSNISVTSLSSLKLIEIDNSDVSIKNCRQVSDLILSNCKVIIDDIVFIRSFDNIMSITKGSFQCKNSILCQDLVIGDTSEVKFEGTIIENGMIINNADYVELSSTTLRGSCLIYGTILIIRRSSVFLTITTYADTISIDRSIFRSNLVCSASQLMVRDSIIGEIRLNISRCNYVMIFNSNLIQLESIDIGMLIVIGSVIAEISSVLTPTGIRVKADSVVVRNSTVDMDVLNSMSVNAVSSYIGNAYTTNCHNVTFDHVSAHLIVNRNCDGLYSIANFSCAKIFSYDSNIIRLEVGLISNFTPLQPSGSPSSNQLINHKRVMIQNVVSRPEMVVDQAEESVTINNCQLIGVGPFNVSATISNIEGILFITNSVINKESGIYNVKKLKMNNDLIGDTISINAVEQEFLTLEHVGGIDPSYGNDVLLVSYP